MVNFECINGEENITVLTYFIVIGLYLFKIHSLDII